MVFRLTCTVSKGLHGRRRPSADRPPVHPSMWTTDRNMGSDYPSHGRIRTLDQDNNLRWTSGRIFDHGPFTSVHLGQIFMVYRSKSSMRWTV